jgi:drug/metabolite transporter (DMT)-like permease
LRQKPALKAIIGMGLSVVGLVLLSINQQFNLQFGLGEALVLGCAFAFAMHIVCIGKFVPDANAINLAIIQLATTSLLCFIAIPIAGEPIASPPLFVWVVVLLMGVVDFAFCFMMMNRAQQFMSGTRAALMYALEPIWAGFFGLLVGQYLSLLAWIGCGFILLGMVVGSIRFKKINIKALRGATEQDGL